MRSGGARWVDFSGPATVHVTLLVSLPIWYIFVLEPFENVRSQSALPLSGFFEMINLTDELFCSIESLIGLTPFQLNIRKNDLFQTHSGNASK